MSRFTTKLVGYFNKKTIFDDASYRSKVKSHFFRLKNYEICEKNSKKNSGLILSKNRVVQSEDEWNSYKIGNSIQRKDYI